MFQRITLHLRAIARGIRQHKGKAFRAFHWQGIAREFKVGK